MRSSAPKKFFRTWPETGYTHNLYRYIIIKKKLKFIYIWKESEIWYLYIPGKIVCVCTGIRISDVFFLKKASIVFRESANQIRWIPLVDVIALKKSQFAERELMEAHSTRTMQVFLSSYYFEIGK